VRYGRGWAGRPLSLRTGYGQVRGHLKATAAAARQARRSSKRRSCGGSKAETVRGRAAVPLAVERGRRGRARVLLAPESRGVPRRVASRRGLQGWFSSGQEHHGKARDGPGVPEAFVCSKRTRGWEGGAASTPPLRSAAAAARSPRTARTAAFRRGDHGLPRPRRRRRGAEKGADAPAQEAELGRGRRAPAQESAAEHGGGPERAPQRHRIRARP
jgi:hypothetical protein